MTGENLTRRNLLASLGAGSFATAGAGFGALTFATEPSLAHENAKETEQDGNDLLFEWVETYNGKTLEDLGNVTADPPGMRLSLGNVLPGDAGALGIKMTVQSDSSTTDPSVTPYFAFDLHETAENDLVDPEEDARDTTDDVGELQDYIDVKIWYDTGLMDIKQLGESNNEQDFGEDLITENVDGYDDDDAEGTLAEVASALPDGADLDEDDPLRLDPVDGDCLTPDDDEGVIIAFGWEFSDDADINVTQTDSVSFDLLFRGEGGC